MEIRHDYAKDEILALCKAAVDNAKTRFTQFPQSSNVIEEFDTIIADLIEETKAERFMRFVHIDPAVRQEAQDAELLISSFLIELTSRNDIYQVLAAAHASDAVLQRLQQKILNEFRKRGVGSPHGDQVLQWQQALSELQTQFEANIASDTTHGLFTDEELAGVPKETIARFHLIDGKRKVTTNSTDFGPVMQYAKNEAVRKDMLEAYENRAQENAALLTQALELRRKIAAALGFANWADFKLQDKMAKETAIVMAFLENLKTGLTSKNKEDLARVQARKQQEQPSADLYPWDVSYYETLLRKEEFSLDEEEVRKHFVADATIQRMFDIYSTLLGITITELKTDAWSPLVNLYEVRDPDGTLVCRFYTDFYPRPGKYEHAAAFTLRAGRMLDGKYLTPLSAIVANFSPATPETPSLLAHREVETLFHEFGHIMHQGLTKAPYAFISGTDVPTDFVEMPSQILENWTWDPALLKQISAHYLTREPLSDELIMSIIAARHFNEGRMYTRQLALSLYDMRIHTHDVDPIVTWRSMYKEVTTLDPLPNTHYPCGFGHIMGGYDAGYYSYLWSLVYAEDLFTRFAKEGLLSKAAGNDYRRLILEPGDSRDQMELMREFLGREPNSEAFLRMLGITT